MTRQSLLATIAVLAVLLVTAPIHAEDEGPPFGASDLAIEDEGLAEGWEVSYDELEGTPGEALVGWSTQIAVAAGIDEDALYHETRVLKGPEDVAATVCVVEVEGEERGLLKALQARGGSLGYEIMPLGHPTRIVIVAAPPALMKQIVKMQTAYAIDILSRLGFERLVDGGRMAAMAFAKGARTIDRKAGPPLALLGMAATQSEAFDEGIEAFREAFSSAATVKPKGRFAMRAYAHYGFACLQKKDDESYIREGRDALQRCIDFESEAEDDDPIFIQRYNLACAHALLKEADPAFNQLRAALKMMETKQGPEGVKGFVAGRLVKDKDWTALRNDARFKALVDKYTGSGAPEGL